MIKSYTSFVQSLLLCGVAFVSCIQDEALNAEADIIGCHIEQDMLIREPVITNNKVTMYVNGWAGLTEIAPTFTLTPGATITPQSGTPLNFTLPQHYTVTSQDGKWEKGYSVEFIKENMATDYHFEKIILHSDTNRVNGTIKQYQIFYEERIDGSLMEWGSGNPGFMITTGEAPATDYPTCQADDGYIGKCLKLTTRSTGPFGEQMGAPIAAGNLFTGTFSLNLNEMAKSTFMGAPFRYRPTELDGYYKYRAGDKFTGDNGQVIEGKRDEFDIYAVFYEVTPEIDHIDGTNSFTAPNIVLMAQLTEKVESDEWTKFTIPFNPKPGKTIDIDKLRSGGYNLAVIFSSSAEGGFFRGAVGSTLYIDEVHLTYETINE